MRSLTKVSTLIFLSTHLWVGCSKERREQSGREKIANQNEYPPLYKGRYIEGFEITSFYPCGITERWQVVADSISDFDVQVQSVEIDKKKYPPEYYVEWRGTISDTGRYGHLGTRNRKLYLSKMNMMKVYEGECSTGK